jgi:hypothetical protein
MPMLHTSLIVKLLIKEGMNGNIQITRKGEKRLECLYE